MRKLVFLLSMASVFIACKDEGKSSGSDVVDEIIMSKNLENSKEEVAIEVFTIDNYGSKFNDLIKRYDSRMRVVLAKQIDGQFTIYQKMLSKLDKAKRMSVTNEEFNRSLYDIQQEVLEQLLESEIIVQVEYYSFLNELNELTEKYKPLNKRAKLTNYETLDRIELSYGVLQKIDELARDEINKKDKDITLVGAEYLSFLTVVPYPAVAGIGVAAQVYEMFGEKVGVFKKKTAVGFNEQLSKEELVSMVKANLPKDVYNVNKSKFVKNESGVTRLEAVKGALEEVNRNNLDLKRDFEMYHDIRNNPKGRIGDYSDGIWTVHYQNLLKIKEANYHALQAK